MKRATTSIALVVAALAIGCGGVRKFPLKDPMWVDQDKRPFMQEPEEYWS